MKRLLLINIIVCLSAALFSFKSNATNPPLLPDNRLEVQDWKLSVATELVKAPWIHDEDTVEETTEEKLNAVVEELKSIAARYLGRRYVWGATGPKTFDCSGFTSYVFRQAGIQLNRTSQMQYRQGTPVAKEDLKPGDLMFFSSPRTGKGVVGHVGMVVEVDEDGKQVTFIHASTSKGITYQKFPDSGYFNHRYIGAKRVLDESHISA
ncbi:MAG: C40 family peptidase [Paramuribaculum sp.]|nr:C40 family peptidase [Paramuribaculum sp.]MDE6460509.1 C40 family peptidase [Paramuribaculum sp.]